jgi:hypothetical protein
MANTRVKVRREVLIEKLEAERKRIVAAHDAEVRKAEKQRAALLSAMADELDELANLLVVDPDAIIRRVEGYYRSNKRDGVAIRFPRLSLPADPSDAAQTYKIDRSIAVLKAAEDDTLSIAANDEYAKYL